jgi:hypothetical protein
MSEIVAKIDQWESAGLIDGQTAARLRGAELTMPGPPAAPPPSGARSMLTGVGTAFGPAASVAEMFAYLGSAFVIAAYSTFLARISDESSNREAVAAGGAALLTIAVIVLGAWMARRGERSRRGAGVLFLVGVLGTAVTASFVTRAIGWTWGAGSEALVAASTLVVAVVLRFVLPALTTQIGLLGGITFVGVTVMDIVKRAMDGRLTDTVGVGSTPFEPRVASVVLDVLLPAVGWLLIALVLGLIGLAEARRGTPAAAARAGLTRVWAGLVAVIGGWSALSASGYLGGEDYGRVLEPWIGDALLGVLVAVLVERAIRRDSAAFILPAAIGLIAALTDLNFRYLTGSPELGLLLEGGILLAVGFSADRFRRWLGRTSRMGTSEPPETPSSELPALS